MEGETNDYASRLPFNARSDHAALHTMFDAVLFKHNLVVEKKYFLHRHHVCNGYRGS